MSSKIKRRTNALEEPKSWLGGKHSVFSVLKDASAFALCFGEKKHFLEEKLSYSFSECAT
jgi:hypothetical protein